MTLASWRRAGYSRKPASRGAIYMPPETAQPLDVPDELADKDSVSMMEALIAFLETRAITTRLEQAEALGLGPAGDVLIARYLKHGTPMRGDIVRRALRRLDATLTYDGYVYLVGARSPYNRQTAG